MSLRHRPPSWRVEHNSESGVGMHLTRGQIDPSRMVIALEKEIDRG